MTVLDKPAVLAGLFAVWRDLDELVGELGASDWQTATSLPGWNVHDVIVSPHRDGVDAAGCRHS